MLVAQHLDLDVARLLDELLDEHAVVAEARQPLALGRLEPVAHVPLAVRQPPAPPPAPPGRRRSSPAPRAGSPRTRRARPARCTPAACPCRRRPRTPSSSPDS